jgi:hypothetical protein
MIKRTNLIARYYVAIRPQTNEYHTVHKEDCPFLPDDNKRIYLGTFGPGEDAVREGRKYFKRSNSCRFCSKEDHEEKINSAFSEIDVTLFIPTESELGQPLAFAPPYFLN